MSFQYPDHSTPAANGWQGADLMHPMPACFNGTYSNITSNATTVVKNSAGFLHSITINKKGATANTATVYDNTSASGSPFATIDTTAATGTLFYDVTFTTGLTIVTASGTAPDITVSYR